MTTSPQEVPVQSVMHDNMSLELCNRCHFSVQTPSSNSTLPLDEATVLGVDSWGTNNHANFTSASQDLQTLEQEIQRLDPLLTLLKKKAATLRDSIETARILAKSYISRLPPELLGEIFEWCLPPSPIFPIASKPFPYIEMYGDGVDTHIVVKLSHVSRRWRTMVLSTPKLWSRIIFLSEKTTKLAGPLDGIDYLDAPIKNPSPSSLINALAHFLKYSQDYPLQIVFQSPHIENHWVLSSRLINVQFIPPWLKLLFEQSHRWACVHFRLYSHQLKDSDFPTNTPLLRSFTLDCDPDVSPVKVPRFIAPRLESLRLAGPTLAISELDLASSHRTLVETCPCLNSLFLAWNKLSRWFPFLNETSPSMSVHLEDLLPDYEQQTSNFPAIVCLASELRVHRSKPHFYEDLPEPLVELLDKILDMPNVHTLKFAGHPAKHTFFPFTSVKSFMSRLQANGSTQNITELILGQWLVNPTELLEVLTLLSSLTHLTLDEYLSECDGIPSNDMRLVSKPFLQAMEIPQSIESDERSRTTCLLPRLTHLSLSFFYLSEEDYITQALLSMVQSRRGPRTTYLRVARLQKLTVHTDVGLFTAEDQTTLLALKEDDFCVAFERL